MALDEAIMQHSSSDEALPTLRLYGWDPPCLSIGYFQSVERDVDPAACLAKGIDLVRRPTGGRAILHHHELTYSVVLPARHPLGAGSVKESYQRISAGIFRGLALLGLQASLGRDRQTPNPSAACFDASLFHELTVDGRKVVGSAQVRRNGAVLQHGSVLLDVDCALLFSLLRLPDERRPALVDSFRKRVVTLGEALGRRVFFEEVAQAIRRGFQEVLDVTFIVDSPTASESTGAECLLGEKYSTDRWNFRK